MTEQHIRTITAPEPHILLFRREKDYQAKVRLIVLYLHLVRPSGQAF